MKKAKKLSLKTVQKNLLTIGAIVSISIGTLKEIFNFFTNNIIKRAEASAPVPPIGTHTLATNHEWTTRAVHHVHSGLEGLFFQIKIWAMHHWNVVLIVAGIILVLFIIFLVDEIKDKIEEAKK